MRGGYPVEVVDEYDVRSLCVCKSFKYEGLKFDAAKSPETLLYSRPIFLLLAAIERKIASIIELLSSFLQAVAKGVRMLYVEDPVRSGSDFRGQLAMESAENAGREVDAPGFSRKDAKRFKHEPRLPYPLLAH
jgi:hypothetical protein